MEKENDVVDVPALARLSQLLHHVGLFTSQRKSQEAIKRGNIYVEINGGNKNTSYWQRMNEVEGFVCISSPTRLRFIDEHGEKRVVMVRPYEGRNKTTAET